jgi:hypothetical protein
VQVRAGLAVLVVRQSPPKSAPGGSLHGSLAGLVGSPPSSSSQAARGPGRPGQAGTPIAPAPSRPGARCRPARAGGVGRAAGLMRLVRSMTLGVDEDLVVRLRTAGSWCGLVVRVVVVVVCGFAPARSGGRQAAAQGGRALPRSRSDHQGRLRCLLLPLLHSPTPDMLSVRGRGASRARSSPAGHD